MVTGSRSVVSAAHSVPGINGEKLLQRVPSLEAVGIRVPSMKDMIGMKIAIVTATAIAIGTPTANRETGKVCAVIGVYAVKLAETSDHNLHLRKDILKDTLRKKGTIYVDSVPLVVTIATIATALAATGVGVTVRCLLARNGKF